VPTPARPTRRIALALAAVLALVALVPTAASAHRNHGDWKKDTSFGATALVLDQGAAAALQSLGVTPGVISPARARNDGLNFPITNAFATVLLGSPIKHAGGISLTAGKTRVELTDFWINLGAQPDLTAMVGGQRAPILDLDFSEANVKGGWRGLVIGPVTGRLTQVAADALNGAFGVTAFAKGLVLGQATVNYSLYPRWYWHK